MSVSNDTGRRDFPEGWSSYVSITAALSSCDRIRAVYDEPAGAPYITLWIGDFSLSVTLEQWRYIADTVESVLPRSLRLVWTPEDARRLTEAADAHPHEAGVSLR